MQEMRATVSFPQVKTTLVAYFKQVSDGEPVATWRVDMCFPAPDGRYHGAFVVLWPEQERESTKSVGEFISELEDALKVMGLLQAKQFDGEYHKSIGTPGEWGTYEEPMLDVVAANGQANLEISAYSDTFNKFYFTLSFDEATLAVDAMRGVPAHGQSLVDTLVALA